MIVVLKKGHDFFIDLELRNLMGGTKDKADVREIASKPKKATVSETKSGPSLQSLNMSHSVSGHGGPCHVFDL